MAERQPIPPSVSQALEAAEQCIVDFLDVYKRGCSMMTLDQAVLSLRDDALFRVRQALKDVNKPGNQGKND